MRVNSLTFAPFLAIRPPENQPRNGCRPLAITLARTSVQSLKHSRFDSGSFVTAVHREFFEQTVSLPRREAKASQRFTHGRREPGWDYRPSRGNTGSFRHS